MITKRTAKVAMLCIIFFTLGVALGASFYKGMADGATDAGWFCVDVLQNTTDLVMRQGELLDYAMEKGCFNQTNTELIK